MQTIEHYSEYLFVFAHPDDEVYTAGLMHRLLNAGKSVTAAFVTSGDAGVNAEVRETELDRSMAAIGVPTENAHKLRFSEHTLLEKLSSIITALREISGAAKPDCIVGMDYEGGHIGHDSSSFVTARLAEKVAVPHYVFPVYHLENGQRKAAAFIPGHEASDIIALSDKEVAVKKQVLAAHAGQADHFRRLQALDPSYFNRLYAQEIYRQVPETINFEQPAAPELGYARSNLSFENFREAVISALQQT